MRWIKRSQGPSRSTGAGIVVLVMTLLAACQSATPGIGSAPASTSSGGGVSASAYSWRMNVNAAPTDPKAIAMEDFATLVRERTSGRVDIQVFPGSTLMSATDAAKETAAGTLVIDGNTGYQYESIVPFLELWSLPFTGLDMTDLHRLMKPGSRALEIVDEALASAHLKFIAAWEGGSLGFAAFKPLNTVESLAGQQIRVSGQVLADCMKKVNAVPISMSGSEAVDGMRRHIVQASQMEPTGLVTRGYDEFAPYWIDWRTGPNSVTIFMNLDQWNQLPADLQTAIADAGREIGDKSDAAAIAAQDEALTKLTKGGMKVVDVTPDERARLREACQDPIKTAIARIQPNNLATEFLSLMDAEAKRLGR
jgi:C4-dicarboxylate-binding protein DctP